MEGETKSRANLLTPITLGVRGYNVVNSTFSRAAARPCEDLPHPLSPRLVSMPGNKVAAIQLTQRAISDPSPSLLRDPPFLLRLNLPSRLPFPVFLSKNSLEAGTKLVTYPKFCPKSNSNWKSPIT